MRVIHELIQGSDEWLAFRAQHFGASEAAAMLGLSKTTTRAQLLHIKHTGLGKEFSEWVQTNVLDHGHEVEALARPHVEALIGADLYPVTCSDGELSASCDGLTMDDATAFEHKQWAEGLAALVAAGVVPDEHIPQCQQIMLVTGAQKVVFVVSDGTPEKMVHADVLPDAAWFARIKAGWAQFAADLATYVPQAPSVAAVAAPIESLPAVLVRMSGALTIESNLDAFGTALRAFIDKIPARPTTDQEFADTDAACKALKKAEEALAGEEGRALASMADVEQMRRLVADLSNLARTTRLAREKMVEARKLEIRTEEVQRGKTTLAEFIAGLNATIGKPYMPASAGAVDFGAAIKGLRSLDSVRAAIDQKLADAKIAANDVAGTIMVNMRHLRENAAEYVTLFPDTAQIVLKAPDDLKALVTSRITEHKAAEAKREEETRERIRAEEQAKADREAERIQVNLNNLRLYRPDDSESSAWHRERIAALEAEPLTEAIYGRRVEEAKAIHTTLLDDLRTAIQVASDHEETARKAAEAAKPAPTPAPVAIASPAPVSQAPFPNVVPLGTRALAAELATLKLGEINARLGFTMTAEFVATVLGIVGQRERGAVLFKPSDFDRICAALVLHIGNVRQPLAA